MLVERLRLIQRQKEQPECLLVRIEESLPESRFLLSVKGIGPITVAGLLGELGPIRNYRNARQLVKMAGINPVQSESAGKCGGRTPMSKKGRPLLRHCLWEACSGLLRYNTNFKSWFERLLERPVHSHPLNKREARGAMCRKLLHLVLCPGQKWYSLSKGGDDQRHGLAYTCYQAGGVTPTMSYGPMRKQARLGTWRPHLPGQTRMKYDGALPRVDDLKSRS